ncbi:hypothetical protein TcWFU_008930 [Taenia crassiceps]|uniref:DUF5727 domain-containing protein n=1 Tax=Taenia crassiceps TaxID=6207 RepID=A0ABR4Q8A8_9CEST
MGQGSANITLDDVSLYEELHVRTATSLFSTALFVPNCAFQEPREDEVDLKAIFPLSRFQKGKSSVEIEFAVEGADSNYWLTLKVNGSFACQWIGLTLVASKLPSCRNLTKDQQANRRRGVLNFERGDADNYTIFEFAGKEEQTTVTVDWLQEGESPEVAECKTPPPPLPPPPPPPANEPNLPPLQSTGTSTPSTTSTESTSTSTTPTPSTTSTESTSTSTTPTTTTSSDALRAGPAVIQMLNVIVALLLTPMLL